MPDPPPGSRPFAANRPGWGSVYRSPSIHQLRCRPQHHLAARVGRTEHVHQLPLVRSRMPLAPLRGRSSGQHTILIRPLRDRDLARWQNRRSADFTSSERLHIRAWIRNCFTELSSALLRLQPLTNDGWRFFLVHRGQRRCKAIRHSQESSLTIAGERGRVFRRPRRWNQLSRRSSYSSCDTFALKVASRHARGDMIAPDRAMALRPVGHPGGTVRGLSGRCGAVAVTTRSVLANFLRTCSSPTPVGAIWIDGSIRLGLIRLTGNRLLHRAVRLHPRIRA